MTVTIRIRPVIQITVPVAVVQGQMAAFSWVASTGAPAPFYVSFFQGDSFTSRAPFGEWITDVPHFVWVPPTDAAAGTSLRFRVTASNGFVAYSEPFVVQAERDE